MSLPALRLFVLMYGLLSIAFAAWAAEPGRVPQFLTTPSKGDPLQIALDYVLGNRSALGLASSDLGDLAVKDRYTSQHNGTTHLYLRQRVTRIEVYNGDLSIHISNDGRVISARDRFVRNLASAAANANVAKLSASEAVVHAAGHLGLSVTQPLAEEKDLGGPSREVFLSEGGISQDKNPARLMYYPHDGSLVLVWNVVIRLKDNRHWWEMNVDAASGKVLSQHNWIVNDSYRVFALPLENPEDGARTLVVNPADATASPFGWHDTDGVGGAEFTDTRGNNVSAQDDRNADNAGGFRPNNTNLVFDFNLNLSQDPTNSSYRSSAIVNLFYWNNVFHDVHYQYGFDEAGGNFQQNNYGHGGLGSDRVQADAQDGSGTDNANFGTPPDGSEPRMQMFIWTFTNPRRDSDLDNGIIAHEYGHGVSTRLTGGPSNVSCLFGMQSGGMGEGWSDWWAIVLTAKPGQTRSTNRPIGTHVLGQPPTGAGIRGFPYSTSLAVNPRTYGDLPGTFGEVHNIGEIWCVALWEVYWNLVDAYGFDPDFYHGTGGNNLAMRLVMDGLKLQPCDPTFLDARDAILLADQVNNGGANQNLLWQAFAKRGMGFSAVDGGDHNSLSVTEAFDLPDDLRISPIEGLLSIGPDGGPFSPDSVEYTLSNVGDSALNFAASKTASWLDLSSTRGSLATGAMTMVTVSINASASALPTGVYRDTVTFSNLVSGVSQTRAVTLRAGQIDNFTELFEVADADLAHTMITLTPNGSGSFYSVCIEPSTSFPVDPAGSATLSLSDDSFAPVTLSGGALVWLYGQSYTTLFIGSNGHITFDSGDITFVESLAAHFSQPRISGLFDDLNPVTGGTISWTQLVDRVAITYSNLPEFGTSNLNNFQIEIFFDGRIRITHLDMAATDGLCGLSPGGGIPLGFVESDLSAYPECSGPGSVDLAITKSATPEPAWRGGQLSYTLIVTNRGTSTATDVLVTDTLPSALTFVSCASSGGGVCAGAGSNRTITFLMIDPGASATITLVTKVKCGTAGGSIVTNSATVTSPTLDSEPGNNSVSVTTTVRGSTITIAATDPKASEPGSNTGKFTVTRTGCTNVSLRVNYGVSGTAIPGNDYKVLSGSVVIPVGKTAATILIKPLNDSAHEPNESVIVTLTPAPAYVVGSPSGATVTIRSDE